MKPFRLSRRAMLRGAGGVAIALPWLEAMHPARHAMAATVPATRFLAVFQPGGTILEHFTPTGTETEFALSPILAPLEPLKDEIIVLSGVDMKSSVGGTESGGMVAWLTGTPQAGMSPNGYAQGPSIDQVLAGRIGTTRTHASIEMAVRWGTGRAHGVIHPLCIVNYGEGGTPIPPRIDPTDTWNALFFEEGTPPEAAWDRSILDAVDKRYARLSGRLGAADRARLEQHLAYIRELEQRLPDVVAACSRPELVDTSDYNPLSGMNSADDGAIRDLETDAAIPKVGKFMMDMLVMAFACDKTAVGTMQWSDAACQHTLPWLNLTQTHRYYMNDGGFHPIECERIATWYSEQHAYLLGKMAGIDRGGHSLLDESVVFFGSNLQNPANYVKTDMPFLLAGRGGGLRPGRWLKYDRASHNDLLVTLLNLFGDSRTTFGDVNYCSGSPLPNLV